MSNDKTCSLPDLERRTLGENLSIIVTIVILIAGFTNIVSGKGDIFWIIKPFSTGYSLVAGLFHCSNVLCTSCGIQILLLFVVFFELVLENMLSFYSYVPLYDKFMHTMLPAILGLIG